jgi:talin
MTNLYIDTRQLLCTGDDPASHRWRRETLEIKKSDVNYRLEHLGAATADILQQTGEVSDRVDHMRVGAAVSTISSNLPEMTRGVRTIAALMETDAQGDSLIGATRKLCGAFSDFLNAVNPDHKEVRILDKYVETQQHSHTLLG